MFTFKGRLLEVFKGKVDTTDYATAQVRSDLVADNQILEYKVDLKKVDFDKLASALDKEVSFEVSLVRAKDKKVGVKITGFKL